MANTQDEIEKEVQRRLAKTTRTLNDEIVELRSIVSQCKNDLVRQHGIITRLTTEPMTFGTLLQVNNEIKPANFRTNDEVCVCDSSSAHYMKGGTIVSSNPVIDDEGFVYVKLTDGIETKFSIGLAGKAPAQVRLSKKDDGTSAIVSLDGKPWEIRGVPDLGLKVGDPVKLRPESKSIVGKGIDFETGPICYVSAILNDRVEVTYKGDKGLVQNPRNIELEEGDRILCDSGMTFVVKKLPQDYHNRYKVNSALAMTWDDIGGLEYAKQQLRDAIESPFEHPELFKHYAIEPLRGVLLYGPTGCGKTLLARVCARAMADLHGKQATDTGYIYVKSPEILNKWIGNTEETIRELFERGRRHYRKFGYKAILAFDEADAIMPHRGTRLTSGIADTMVPMFLGEMDGIDDKQTKENPIVLLMTNRANSLDQAIVRSGRISRHIKIDRPDENTAIDILSIYAKNVPFVNEANKSAMLAITAADIFSKSRLLYRINNEHDFSFGDCINGATLEEIVQIAKINAFHRDKKNGTKTGVVLEDLRSAVSTAFHQQRGLSHEYDLQDFAEKVGIQYQNMQITRCFSAS